MAHPNQPWPWNPTTTPFRACYTSTQRSYWRPADVVYTFATEQEMREFAANTKIPGTKVEFHVAVIPEGSTWQKKGHWQKLKG